MADTEAKSEGVKVFCGNLSFSVTEDELSEHFAKAGKVVSANIISRGNRSRGYGFVEMATLAEAEKAVELMNKVEVSGRPIKVEVAKPREESAEGSSSGEGRARAAGGRARGRGRSGRGRGRARGRGAQKKAPEDRALSEDTLFVANLPFSTDDEALKTLFAEFKPKEAHVVTGRGGRSKGFGFVVFDNKEGQQNALAKIDKTEVEGREVAVRVAFNAEDEVKEEEKAEKAE